MRHFSRRVSGHISYSWQTYDADHGEFEKDYSFFLAQTLPEHKAVLGLNVKPWLNGSFHLNSRYTGSRENKAGDVLDGYILVNAGYQHDFYLRGTTCSLKGFAANLLNREYQERYGYPAPGINLGAEARFKF